LELRDPAALGMLEWGEAEVGLLALRPLHRGPRRRLLRVDDLYEKTESVLGEQVLAEVVTLGARYQVTCFVLNAYEEPVPD
jgi:hypothetical protein